MVADTVDAVCDAVRQAALVLPVAGATKPALSSPPTEGVTSLDVSGLRGVLDYDPGELTLTALAGTPIAALRATLAEHGQHLPFDPPLADAGATLGGTVAAGVSGPGALRHGGVRDFVIGVRLVDGTGTLVAGGGKVVKNAAGFDLPKLMVGSMGRLGVLVEVSLKVFPRPRATTTLIFELGTLSAALDATSRMARGPITLDALDLEPPGRLLVRLGGEEQTLSSRALRLERLVGAAPMRVSVDEDLWRAAAELTWVPAGHVIVRAAVAPRHVAAIEQLLDGAGAARRYAAAANVVWIAWPSERPLDALDAGLKALGLAAVRLTGPPGRPLFGAAGEGAFAARLRAGLDPDARFLEV